LSHTIFEPAVKKEGLQPLLITHGLLGSKQNWTSIAKAISRTTNRRVITFDARNHGDSPHSDDMNYSVMLEDIKNLANHLSLPKFSLLGHSMGGLTSMSFALKYPDYLEKLVIVDIAPTIEGRDFSGNEHYIRVLLDSEPDFSNQDLTLSNARKILDKALEAKVQDKAVRAFLLTNLSRNEDTGVHWKPNLRALLKNINDLREFPSELKKKTFNGPTLFIRGGKSPYVPNEALPEIKRIFPTAQVATMESSGHWCHADNPSEFLNIVLPFLQA
jgi:abhydrolase domain-containing protein 11